MTTTSPGGAKAASKADWGLLRGRTVVVWPDNDAPGAAYAQVVAKHAATVGALNVSVITLPPHRPDGWDAADALPEGWDEVQSARLLGEAKSPGVNADEPNEGRAPRHRRFS